MSLLHGGIYKEMRKLSVSFNKVNKIFWQETSEERTEEKRKVYRGR
jgi:hypothetical protein